MSSTPVPEGAPIAPTAPLLARPYLPASCTPYAWRDDARIATASDAAEFQPGTVRYWTENFSRVGRGGTAAAALAVLLGFAILATGLCCSCCGAVARRRRKEAQRVAPVGAAATSDWAGGLVLPAGEGSSSHPPPPPPPPPRSSRAARTVRWLLRVLAVAAALASFIASSIGAARVSSLTAAAVPDFWAAVAAAQAATAVAVYAAKGSIASLGDTAAGLEALGQALEGANSSALLAAVQKAPLAIGRDGKAAAAGISSVTAKVVEAAAAARAAEEGGRAALARFDGSDGGGGGGGLEAVADFREKWQARSTAAAPRVRAAGIGATLGLLAVAALVGGAVAAVDPGRPGVPLAVAAVLCLAAAVSAAGGLAGVRTARSASKDACLFAESTASAALIASAGAVDGDAITTIARYYLDTPPGEEAAAAAEEEAAVVLPAAGAAPPGGADKDAGPPEGRGKAGTGSLALTPAPVRSAGSDLPPLAAPAAPNLRLGGGRDAPNWAMGGGGGGSPPAAKETNGPVSFVATPPQGGGSSTSGNNTNTRRRRHLSAEEEAPPPPPPTAAPPPAPKPGLATALGLDVGAVRAALADPTTVALLNTLNSGAGKALLSRTSLTPAAQAAAEALPTSVAETAARLDAFEAASGRDRFRPALVALKKLPCCTAETALGVWGGAWVAGGLGALGTALAAAALGLWRGGR